MYPTSPTNGTVGVLHPTSPTNGTVGVLLEVSSVPAYDEGCLADIAGSQHDHLGSLHPDHPLGLRARTEHLQNSFLTGVWQQPHTSNWQSKCNVPIYW